MAPERTPCAACKFLRRKCSSDCIFAPYFPQDQTQKFINLHRVYGTANVQKLLAELPVDQRQDAVNSLAYEAEARRLDPVYGCTGPIVFLHHRVQNLKGVLQGAYKELAAYQDAVLKAQEAMGGAGFPADQPTPDMMQPLRANPLSASSSSEPYKMASMMGNATRGSSLEIHEPGPQGSNNNTTFDPEQLFMPTATVGTEQLQEIIRDYELQPHGQDIRFDRGQGFDVGTGSSSGVGVVGFSLSDPGPQSNNNNNTLHPEQLVTPIATVSLEQQETIRAFELQQLGLDIGFDRGQGFDVATGSSTGVGVVGYRLNNPGPQSNNNNTLHRKQFVMPTATIGTEQQEIIRAFDMQQHRQDNRGQGFNVGAGSSTGIGVVGYSLNNPGPQSNKKNSTLHPDQLVVPIATVGTEQQETIRAFELQQQGQDNRFDWGRHFDVGTGSTNQPEQLVMPITTVGSEQQETIRPFKLQQHGQGIGFDGGQGFDVGTGSSSGIGFDRGKGFDVGTGSSTGVGVVGYSLNNPGPQSNSNNSLHPEQFVMPTAAFGLEQQDMIRAFEMQQHGQDNRFNRGQGFDVGAGSSTGVGVVWYSLNNPGPQSNKNNSTLHPEQLIVPIATVGTEQQETIRASELLQQGQDIWFDGGQGFDVGTGSSNQPEQLVMPIATVGSEQQDTIRPFELQQHMQGIGFDGGQGFDVGTGSSSGIGFDWGQGFDVGTGSTTGIGEVGYSLNNPGPQSNNNKTLHPKQFVMPTATVGTEQQEIIRAFEMQQHRQDDRFDRGQGFDIGAGSSTGVGVVGYSLNNPGPQSNKNNSTLHPEQLVVPIATVGTEHLETIKAVELQQQGQDIWFDGGQGFDVELGSSTRVGVVGFSLTDRDPQSNNQNNFFDQEPLFMPTAPVGVEQLQEIIRDFELQQQGQDIRFERGQGFDVGTGSSSGVGVAGFSLNDRGPQSNNNNALHPEQLVTPIATVGSEQQETIRPFELQQHEQDIWFDGGQGFDVGTGSSSGVGDVGFSLNEPCPQSSNKNTTLYPEQLVIPIATVGTEQQEAIRAFELQQQGQDIWFDGARGFNVGAGSSTGDGVVGFSLNDPGPQCNNNNTLHPEQLVTPMDTVGTEQLQQIIRALELQQHMQDIGFDRGEGFDFGTGGSTGVGVVGFSLNDPCPQGNNNNTLHPEQLVMPIATVGSEQQETIRVFELQQHGQDISFDGGRGFDVGAGRSTGVGNLGFSLNNPPSSSPMIGCFESGFIHPHFQPQLSFQPQQVVAVQEHHTQELESQEERLQGQNVGNDEVETSSSFYYVDR